MPRFKNLESWRKIADAALHVLVFLATFFYRFNTLGGTLGGFSNDEFGYLARARQIQAGEVPFRDFNDPGWFLTDYLSAAGQWLGGYNLRSEALLTVGMLSLGAALTFALARRIAGSTIVALAAVALYVALEPRHYNYPKIVFYAAGLAVAWAYIDRPQRLRLAALGALTGIGFLFRHDHLVYLGVLSLVTIAAVHRPTPLEGVRAAIGWSTVAAIFVVPFLVFLALSGGVGEYFRSALVYAARDAERTSFSFPRFSIDPSKPLLATTRGAPAAAVVAVNVRWASISEEQRRDRESKYGLAGGMPLDGSTWRYVLQDVSRVNIESLVRDPIVEDTHGIDRTTFAVAQPPQPLWLETQLDTLQNATAFLYYAFLIMPLLAGLALLRLRRVHSTRVLNSVRHLVPLLVLAVMLNVGFLSRGSTNIRIPDVGVTSTLLLAWLIAMTVGRDARLVVGNRVARACLRAAVVVVLCSTLLSVNGFAHASRSLREAGFTRGPTAIAERAGVAWRTLGQHPSAFTQDDEQPRLLRIAAYVRACTAPEDRLFILGHYPELYYFSDRRFAGGHAWLLPFYYSNDADEALIVSRLKLARAAVILTEGRPSYDEEYRDVFEQVHDYMEEGYTEAGQVDTGGPLPLRVLVRADLKAARRYEPLDLPCFTEAAPSR